VCEVSSDDYQMSVTEEIMFALGGVSVCRCTAVVSLPATKSPITVPSCCVIGASWPPVAPPSDRLTYHRFSQSPQGRKRFPSATSFIVLIRTSQPLVGTAAAVVCRLLFGWSPLPSSSRQHLSYDDCLEDAIIRAVLCCVVYDSCALEVLRRCAV